jgi:hypothetical protein
MRLGPLRETSVQPAPKSRSAVTGIFAFEDQKQIKGRLRAFRLKLTPLDERDLTVGAGLLANAFCQSIYSYLTHRVRQQAGSYRKNAFRQVKR